MKNQNKMADRKIFIDDSPKNPHLKRSPFDLSFVNNSTYQFGKVGVPYFQYCPPGTKLSIKPTFAFKLAPLVYPTQTNVRAHLKFYKVPLRILWEDFEDFQAMIGTNGLPTNGGGTQFVVPYVKRSSGWNDLGSLAEQLGCGNVKYIEVNSLSSFVGKRRILSTNIPFVPSTALPSFYCYDVFLKAPHKLSSFVYSSGSYDCNFVFTCLTSYANSLPTGTVTLDLFSVNSDGSLHSLNKHIDFNRVTSSQAFNNSTESCFTIGGYSTQSLNGFTVNSSQLLIRIVDDNFIEAVNLALSLGNELCFRFSATGNMRIHLFPDMSNDSLSVIRSTSLGYEKVDTDTGNLTSTSQVQNLIERLGIIDTCSIAVKTVDNSKTTIFDSFDGEEPVQPVCALPFRALEFIHNYFMRNPRIDPFEKDGVPSYNKFLTNTASGADSTTPVDSWNALYETDYFTSCVKEPQFGNAPLVGVTVNDLGDKGILRFDDGEDVNNYTVEVPLDENGAALPITMYKDIADRPNIQRLQELIQFGISINDLRNVSTFQRMLERMQRTGHRYANVVYEFFGTNPPIGDHYPRYLGGLSRNISVDEITNTALSEGAKLGEFAGRASFAGQGKTIKCFCSEASYVIGIIYFSVTPTYSQYLPKHLTYKHPLDFYLNPDFAYMGPQPVLVKEVAPTQVDEENLNDVFGYNRPYAELASRVDEVHGEFRTTMANFLLQRMFGSVPQLNKSFIEIDPQQLLNIFSVTDTTDKIWGQLYFKVKALLPLPRSYQPRSI